ncbi:MAG: PQQ-binding-like beta-propeller repeat protein [Pseudomonadales bacterium]|nr:PQQ-binding-like beta-propeller repeat protein [Pseudomonadales bacterium]MBO6655427.1 PQQ-binding-like beta-propeller repeat protein [Pseudomonadales bacterium]
MPDLKSLGPQGVLRDGWTATADEFAFECGWAMNAKALLVGDVAGGVYAFEGTSGNVRWTLNGLHEGGMLAMSIHPEGKVFATSGQDGRLTLRSAKEGQVIQEFVLGEGWIEHLAWSPNGRMLAATLSRRVFVFDIDGQQIWRSEDQASTVSAIAWASDEQLATACYSQVNFFDVKTGESQQKLEWKGSLVSMVLSADGDIVACGSQDNSVHFWRRSTGEDSMMSGYPGKPGVLAFDRTGSVLATGGHENVTVWSFEGDGPEGTTPGMLDLHVKPVSCLEFARRGLRLASGARDGSVAVWELETNGQGEAVGAAFSGSLISSMSWRPDGRALAMANAKGGITVFRVRS